MLKRYGWLFAVLGATLLISILMVRYAYSLVALSGYYLALEFSAMANTLCMVVFWGTYLHFSKDMSLYFRSVTRTLAVLMWVLGQVILTVTAVLWLVYDGYPGMFLVLSAVSCWMAVVFLVGDTLFPIYILIGSKSRRKTI